MWHCRQSQFPPASQSIRQTLRLDKSFAPPRQNTFQNSSLLYTTKATVVCIFYLNFELQLGKSNKFNDQGIKLLVRSSFKNHFFCHQKNSLKADRPCKRLSPAQQLSQHLTSKSSPIILFPPFSKNISTPRQGSTKWQTSIVRITTIFLQN